ncbi:MAG: hypothetical protein JWM86_567, partial [Thermoleophilia bacterium]|nr:hypothetical protein [Thermoleophilia bacterium]
MKLSPTMLKLGTGALAAGAGVG